MPNKIHANIKPEPQDTPEQTLYIILEAYKDTHYKNAEIAIRNIKELFKSHGK